MSDNEYDVIIVGAGPAGLTAAIYTQRKGLKTLILSQDLGGQVVITSEIENYPGFDSISGPELVDKFRKQVEKFGGKIVFGEVVGLEKGEVFKVKTSNAEYQAKAVILAFGLTPRSLGVPGEDKFKGRGISFCATCDAPLYKGKTVALVGGGNSAMEAVEELTAVAAKVYLIHRRDVFTGDKVSVDRLAKYQNLEKFLGCDIVEFKGDKKIESLVLRDKTGKKPDQELKVDGVFLEIGHITKTEWLKGVIELDESGQIIRDDKCVTSEKGIFAAGDVTTLAYKQIVISAGEGAKAALSAYNYISKSTAFTAPPDWGRKK